MSNLLHNLWTRTNEGASHFEDTIKAVMHDCPFRWRESRLNLGLVEQLHKGWPGAYKYSAGAQVKTPSCPTSRHTYNRPRTDHQPLHSILT
jgi:hypothetical protein